MVFEKDAVAETVSKNAQKYVHPVKDFNYKIMVLNTYNQAKTLITEAYTYGLRPHMVAGAFEDTKMLTGMIFPFVSNSVNIVDEINELLRKLNVELLDLETYSFSQLTKFLDKCANVIIKLTPLLAYIGISNKQMTVGTFSFPGEKPTTKPISDCVEDDADDEDDYSIMEVDL